MTPVPEACYRRPLSRAVSPRFVNHSSVYCLNTWYAHPCSIFFPHHQIIDAYILMKIHQRYLETNGVIDRKIISYCMILNSLYKRKVRATFTKLRNVPNTAATIAAVTVCIITNNSIPTTMTINITPKPNSIKYDQSPLMSTCRPIDLSSLTYAIMPANKPTSVDAMANALTQFISSVIIYINVSFI